MSDNAKRPWSDVDEGRRGYVHAHAPGDGVG